jgi:hypothetical protein
MTESKVNWNRLTARVVLVLIVVSLLGSLGTVAYVLVVPVVLTLFGDQSLTVEASPIPSLVSAKPLAWDSPPFLHYAPVPEYGLECWTYERGGIWCRETPTKPAECTP